MFRNLFRRKPKHPDPEQLLQTIFAFIQADTWAESQRIVENHPELLTNEADTLLEQLVQAAREKNDETARQVFEEHRALLRRCRAVGVEQAFAELLRAEDGQVGAGEMPIPPQFTADLQQAIAGVQGYQRTGDLVALNTAVAAWERILNHPDFAQADEGFRRAAWNEAGGAYLRRYWRTGQVEDLNAALRLWQQAVQATPKGHPDLPSRLNNLGNGLWTRYSRTGRMEDLEEAIRVHRQAVQATPPDRPNLPSPLNNLGAGLRARYSRTGRLEDLEEAIRVHRQAVQATPKGHPDLPGYLSNLGTGLSYRYSRTGRLEDLEEGQKAYRQAAEFGLKVNPSEALRAARNWTRWAFVRRAWKETLEAYAAVRQAQERRLAEQFRREDKAFSLSETQGLAAQTAYAAAQVGDLRKAVEILEAGRAQLLREALERQRRDLHALAGGPHDALYRAYTQAADELERLHSLPYDQRPADWGAQLSRAQEALEAAIAAIREGVPGFAYFLKPLPFAEIRAQAHDAPLVYLAATAHGGLALVVGRQAQTSEVSETSEVLAAPLPQLTEKALRERVQGPDDDPALGGYLGAYLRWRGNPGDAVAREGWFAALEATLTWLGKAVMGPVVAALHEAGVPQGAVVRLIPAGWLVLLPLHAAALTHPPTPSLSQGAREGARLPSPSGREVRGEGLPPSPSGRGAGGEGEITYALDHYTFTYAPSAQALYHASAAAQRPPDSLLAVDNPDGSLVFTEAEVREVLHHRWQNPIHLQGAAATKAAVLDALPRAAVLHFSTHGAAGWGEAGQSRLRLTDGDLTLREIYALQLPHARLGVLSACETGVPGTKLPDEVESLPSGLMQSGVPGVVGSLWSVNDLSTALLMARFYDLWREGDLPPAEALRQAQIWMRDSAAAEMRDQFKAAAGLTAQRMSEHSAAAFYARINWEDDDARPFAHPFHWAAFSYTGL